MFTTYVVYNADRGKIYIGHTSDLEKRLYRHNKRLPTKRSSFTAKQSGIWCVVYGEQFLSRTEAIHREKELKSAQGRKFIWNKINSENT